MGSFVNTGLTVDGTLYDVLVQFSSLVETPEGVILSSGETINKVKYQHRIGTVISYELVIDPKPGHLSDYDDLRTVLTDANDPIHEFVLPRINGTLTFDGVAQNGADEFRGVKNGSVVWGAFKVNITPTDPQVTI